MPPVTGSEETDVEMVSSPSPAQEAMPPVTGSGETEEAVPKAQAIALPDKERTDGRLKELREGMKKDRVVWADQVDDEEEVERKELPFYPLVVYSEQYVSCNYFDMKPVGFLESNSDALLKNVNKNINNLLSWRSKLSLIHI